MLVLNTLLHIIKNLYSENHWLSHANNALAPKIDDIYGF